MKERNYEALMAGMRKVSTITDAEELIRNQPKIKLPDRRSIALWNSPELGQFRGVSEDLDAAEERRHKAQLEQLEIKKASRDGDVAVPDMNFVHEALRANQQHQATMQQHAADLSGVVQQQQRGMKADMLDAMERLMQSQAEAQNRARIAEEVGKGFTDLLMDDRARLGRLVEAAGLQQPQMDNSVVNNSTVINMAEQSDHRELIDAMRMHSQQIGQHMQEQNVTAVEAAKHVAEALRNQPTAPVFHVYPQLPQGVGLSQEVGGVSGAPPPPPPGAGAVRTGQGRARKAAAPYDQPMAGVPVTFGPPPPPPPGSMGAILTPIAVPAPMIDTVVPQFSIGTPRRGQSETPTYPFGLGNPRAARAPRATTPRPARSRSKGPAPAPMEEEVVPQFVPPPRAKAARARSASATPVPTIGAAAAAAAIVDRDVIPVPKARAKAKARGRSESVEQVPVPKRKASKSTSIQAASLEPTPVLRPRAKSTSRSLGPKIPDDLPDVIPQVRTRKKPNNMQSPAATAAAIGKTPSPAPMRQTTKPPASKRVPSAAPQGNRKPMVRKVSIAPSAKAAASMPGVKGRKPRNKTPLVAEIERLKA